MPYSAAYDEKTITVQALELSLEADRRVALPGQQVTFTARLLVGGAGYRGATVAIVDRATGRAIGYPVTDANGYATFVWTVPWELDGARLPCTDREFYAYALEFEVYSGSVMVAIGYPTRIYSLTVSPSTVTPGGTIEVSGYLQYEYPEGTWNPLAGRSVDLSIIGPAGVVAGTRVTTNPDGSFYTTFTAPSEPGTYRVRARFDGEGLPTYYKAMYHYAPAVAETGVSVGKPSPAPLLATLGAVAGALGIAYIVKRYKR